MEYRINFDSGTSTVDLSAALSRRFGIGCSVIYAGEPAELGDYRGPAPVVVVSPAADGRRFGCTLQGGAELADRIGGVDNVELARLLCVDIGTCAVVAGGRTGWSVVTVDGNVAEVVIDDDVFDQEGFVIVAAATPIPGMPTVPVRSRAWCDERFDNGGD